MEIQDWTADAGRARLYKQARELGLETNLAELDAFGFTVVPAEQASNPDLVDRLLARITEIAADRNNGVKPDFQTGSTHADMVSPAGQHLFYLMGEDRAFQEALMNPVVQTLVQYLVGEDVLLSSATSMIKGPGKIPLPLHSDQPIHPIPKSLVCNATYLLSDYNRENGALCFVPGSHRSMRQPTAGENFGGDVREAMMKMAAGETVEFTDAPNAVPIEAPQGSLVVWHGNTWHGAFNRTAPGLRVNLILYFCSPHIRPQEAYREQLAQDVLDANDDGFARLMGRDVWYGWTSEGPQYVPKAAFEGHRRRANANTAAAT